ncbi:DUF3054 domain-containing protein [Arthrobacter sp. AETb3-4]|jgi:hypothetical protein|uniref:DUF3054 domain-containing protein n=2 Tax=Arthrobacter wenxiniae TaxID=2713570 RepID=A0A7Y7II94_9MICC|nr:DUF3054 domain-containing protein [Arthrobacter wenxiniae]NVM95988.1 DUF3054 domain-containing protein [Arthrobacter wenxiniae]
MDVLLVLVFALSGRSSHHESLSAGGVLTTAWPFLAALALGWLLTRNWRQPVSLWPQGVCIWLITVAGGMALRILSGETAQTPFVIVATLVLGVFLLGQRLIGARVARRGTTR